MKKKSVQFALRGGAVAFEWDEAIVKVSDVASIRDGGKLTPAVKVRIPSCSTGSTVHLPSPATRANMDGWQCPMCISVHSSCRVRVSYSAKNGADVVWLCS
jgi:hypothetical protein